MKEEDEYNCNHFSLALPAGEDQDNVPKLLEHLANELKSRTVEIMDIVFRDESDENGNPYPSFTVYYAKD